MKRSKAKKRAVQILIATLITGIVVYVTFRLIQNWHQKDVEMRLALESKVCEAEKYLLSEKIISLQEELSRKTEAVVPEEKLLDVFGQNAKLPVPGEKYDCDELESQVAAFFKYLDTRDYIKSYGLENGTAGFFRDMIVRVSGKTPTVIGETRDIITLVRNMAHFYRVMGKKQIKLLSEILINEAEIIEPVMAAFFARTSHEGDCGVRIIDYPSLQVLYEYAGFFLNTLSGRSYLFRRDSTVRTLVSYYCVIIIDRANTETANYYGIDIRPYIEFSMFNIYSQKRLAYQQSYLSELERLKQKYRM